MTCLIVDAGTATPGLAMILCYLRTGDGLIDSSPVLIPLKGYSTTLLSKERTRIIQ
jgi:hypothetical protein